jgi:hypothetical protein
MFAKRILLAHLLKRWTQKQETGVEGLWIPSVKNTQTSPLP